MKANRILGVALGMGVLFGLLFIQFYRIQIVEGPHWTKVANRQHYFYVKDPYKRGTFISNSTLKQGHPDIPQKLVVDIEKYHLYIDPESLPEKLKDRIAIKLQEFLELKDSKTFKAQLYKKSRNRKLAMWLEQETRNSILEWWGPFAKKNKIPRNAVYFVNDYQRSYPFGKLLGQVLHTIQNVKDEKTNKAIPTGGLELYFNSHLEGKIGKRRLMRSPRNSMEIGEVLAVPENGADIYLTINHTLQAIAEEEVAKGVKNAKAKAGWAVMMDPKTGDILALAQYPFFNPSDYQTYFNDPLLVEYTPTKAVTDAIEPGSVVKPFSMAIGLMANEELKARGEKPLFDPEEKISTSSGHFPGRSRPLTDTTFHAYMNMEMALMKSANIYWGRLMEKIIHRLGTDWYRSKLQDSFGFGIKTGIELPSETKGVLPLPGKKHPNGALEWSQSTPISLSIGYNLQLNSIQLLRAYSILANGGYLVKPTLIRKIVKDEKVIFDQSQNRNFPRVMSPEIAQKVLNTMKYATKPGGTARRADIWGYTECGKTSTSKKNANGVYSDTLYRSTFIGVTPVKDPAFVLVVTMDEPEYGYIPGVGKGHHGGVCTAPVFKEIAKRSLEYLGIAPDDPYGYPPGDPRFDAQKADWIPESRRLQEKYEKWNKKSEQKS